MPLGGLQGPGTLPLPLAAFVSASGTWDEDPQWRRLAPAPGRNPLNPPALHLHMSPLNKPPLPPPPRHQEDASKSNGSPEKPSMASGSRAKAPRAPAPSDPFSAGFPKIQGLLRGPRNAIGPAMPRLGVRKGPCPAIGHRGPGPGGGKGDSTGSRPDTVRWTVPLLLFAVFSWRLFPGPCWVPLVRGCDGVQALWRPCA